MATLHLHATADAVEHEWRRALAAGGIVELGLGRATPRELVESAAVGAVGERLRLGPIGERLVIDAVAEGAGGALASIAQSRGLRKSLGRIFGALGRVGVEPGELQRAALDAGGMAGAHAAEIARRLGAYHKHLGSGGLVDEAALWRAGCRAIAGGAAVPMLAEDVDVVETHDLFDWDGAQLQLLDALLARGLVVRVIVPAGFGGQEALPPSAARALAPLLGALEARHEAHRLERVEAPLARPPAIDYTLAPTPSAEARHVAERVRDLVDAGVAPETIAVCAATPERRASPRGGVRCATASPSRRGGRRAPPRRRRCASPSSCSRSPTTAFRASASSSSSPRATSPARPTARTGSSCRTRSPPRCAPPTSPMRPAAATPRAWRRGRAATSATCYGRPRRDNLPARRRAGRAHPVASGRGHRRAPHGAPAHGGRQAGAVPARARLSQGRGRPRPPTRRGPSRATRRRCASSKWRWQICRAPPRAPACARPGSREVASRACSASCWRRRARARAGSAARRWS